MGLQPGLNPLKSHALEARANASHVMRSVGNMQTPSALRKPANVRVTSLAHQIWSQVLSQGNLVVDATCGRGADTLWLAKAVGPQGIVYALDIQVRLEVENGLSPSHTIFAARDC